MPATRTTRRGNGPGRGGPANGPGMGDGWGGELNGPGGPAFSADDPGYAAAISALARDPQHHEAKVLMLGLAYTTWVEVARDKTNPQRTIAADKIVDRILGKAVQSTDLTSKGEKLGGYVVAVPVEAEDTDAWQSQHGPQTGA